MSFFVEDPYFAIWLLLAALIVSWKNVDILEEIPKGATKEKMLAPMEIMLEAG